MMALLENILLVKTLKVQSNALSFFGFTLNKLSPILSWDSSLPSPWCDTYGLGFVLP